MEYASGQQVWVQEDFYSNRRAGVEPTGFGKLIVGTVAKATTKSVTVRFNNKDRFGAKTRKRRYPICLVSKSKKDAVALVSGGKDA